MAAKCAREVGSAAVDAVSFVAELGEGLPLFQPVVKTLTAIREKVKTVTSNREDLAALGERCVYITACVIVKFRKGSSELDVAPLEDCIRAAGVLVEHCGRRGKLLRVVKASSDRGEIAALNTRIRALESDMGLAGITVVGRKIDDLKTIVGKMANKQAASQEQILENQSKILDHMAQLSKTQAKLTKVPKGTPARKSWYVERRYVMDTVFEGLASDGGPRLVGLVGGSGSGKTTVASATVRSTKVQEAFSDGIAWLSVNDGAKERLSSLMLQLARVVYEDIGCSVGRRPTSSDDCAAYIRQRMKKGTGGKKLKCLVVADNVWDKEVVSKLLETEMWVLLSTRNKTLVTEAHGEVVGVDELSEADAMSVLRRAAELPSQGKMPGDAVDLIELCGRVAMDLAFVGRWSTVRGRQDRTAWSDAASKVRGEMSKVRSGAASDKLAETRDARRKAILRAGFEDLAIGSDDERVQRLYLSLAILPDGHAFTVRDAAVLLYDREPSAEDEASVAGVVDTLERWTVLRSAEGAHRMHDAHSIFARETLMDHGYVRRPAVRRWVSSISCLEALRSSDPYVLKGLWLAVEGVGGDGWLKSRAYSAALVEMDPLHSALARQNIIALARLQEAHEDWEGASTTWRRLLEIEKQQLGADHYYVLKSYRSLASCAEQLGHVGEAADWRGKEVEALPLALARVQSQADRGRVEGLDGANGLASVASTMLKFKPGDRAQAEVLLRRSLEIQEAALGQEDIAVADTLYQLGICLREAGRLEEAEEHLRRSLAITEARLGREDVRVATTLHSLGMCLRMANQLAGAEAILRRGLTIKEAKLGRSDFEVARTLYELGVCVRLEAGRLDEADKVLRRCLDIVKRKLGHDSEEPPCTPYTLVPCPGEADRLGHAEQKLRRCLATEEAQLSREDVGVARTLYNLGTCLRTAGRLGEGEEVLRCCVEITEEKLGPDHVHVAYTLHELDACLRGAGRLQEAEGLLIRCLDIMEAALGRQDLRVSNALYELGVWVRQAGRLGEAEQLLRRCLTIEEAKLGQRDTQVVSNTLYSLGVCLEQAGRRKEAEEMFRRSFAIEDAHDSVVVV
ncbi:unnamed protein product [Ectocarpus sp. 13 AM-2016]